jgi:hypothetical protein
MNNLTQGQKIYKKVVSKEFITETTVYVEKLVDNNRKAKLTDGRIIINKTYNVIPVDEEITIYYTTVSTTI